jgi:dCMP deaminase
MNIKFLEDAYKAAMILSTDPRTQNGAILVLQNGFILRDANHFPTGVTETPERWKQPLKYKFVEHAERNVILQAARIGYSTLNATMYVPWFACADCARSIIQAGVKKVVGHDAPFHNRPDWQNNIDVADTMLKEASIDFIRIVHKFSGIEILFDGVKVEP